MIAPGSPSARVLRAAWVSLWACLGAAVAHVVGAGEPPPALAFVPVALASAALTWCCSGRRWSVAALCALLAFPHLAVHLLSSYLHGHAVVPEPSMTAAHVVGLVVVATAIARIERLWWSWWQTLASVLQRTLVTVLPVARPATIGPGALLVMDPPWTHAVVRRGPPFS